MIGAYKGMDALDQAKRIRTFIVESATLPEGKIFQGKRVCGRVFNLLRIVKRFQTYVNFIKYTSCFG